MAGQLAVWGFETKLSQKPKMARGDAQGSGSFLGKPWKEALDAFRARGIVDDNELSTLLGDMAKDSVEAQKLLLERVQTNVRSMLETAIEDGQGFDDFAKALRGGAQGLGITATDDSYLRMVFRTNVLGAYGEGRKAAFNDPDIQDARPYVEYRTAGDARVSENHAVLDGLVFDIKNGLWRDVAPVRRPNCRCSLVTLSAQEAADREITDELPDEYEPE